MVGVNDPLDWYHTISTGWDGCAYGRVNEPLDWYHAISTWCDGRVYGQCEWTIRLVPRN